MANPFFDAAYYLAQNPDVEAAFGDDAAAAEAHYIANGADEGRKPAQWFDAAYYQSSNADLAGLAPNELFEHFANYGVNELRSPSEGLALDAATFQAYAAANEDLRNAFEIEDAENLTDEQVAALANHFFAHGINEDREGAPVVPDEPVDLTELTEALEVYQEAAEAKSDFLEEALENEDVRDELPADVEPEDATATQIEAAIEAAVEAARVELNTDKVTGDVADGGLGYDFTAVTDSALPGMIEDVREELEDLLTKADADVSAVKNLKTAITSLVSSKGRYEAAVDGQENAETAFDGEVAKVIEINADVTAVGYEEAVAANPDAEPPVAATPAYLTINGENVAESVNGKVKILDQDAAGEVDGFDALLNAFASFDKADLLLASRTDAFLSAANRVRDAEFAAKLENDGTAVPETDFTELATFYTAATEDDPSQFVAGQFSDETEAYLGATEDLAEFNAAVSAYQEVGALAEELEARTEAVDSAREAIEDLEYNLIEFDTDDLAVGTEENDVFVYVGADEATIELFGEVGEDVLFIGTEFTYNDDIENGDAGVLEVFFTQEGDDTVVTIEQTAFGTNADSQEIDTITLTGVTADDLAFVDGYVVFA